MCAWTAAGRRTTVLSCSSAQRSATASTAEPRHGLAEQIDVDQATLSRIIAGAVPLTLDRLAEIERALGVVPGTFFRAGGYIADGLTVPSAITADKALTSEQKRTLRNVYDLAVSSTRPPRTRRT